MSTPTPGTLIADRLRYRVRTRGAEPLLTYYDLRTDERTELSATSFANWVDKTSNLLADEYLVEVGDAVNLALATHSPGHWVTFVVEMAAWQVGAVVTVDQHVADDEILVLGPEWDGDVSGVANVLACALHPLGLGFAQPLPAGVADFSLEVRAQPDHHSPGAVPGSADAWVDGQRGLNQLDLVSPDIVGLEPTPRARRTLVHATDPWPTVRDGLLLPLLTGGSTVLVVGESESRLTRIAQTERVDIRS